MNRMRQVSRAFATALFGAMLLTILGAFPENALAKAKRKAAGKQTKSKSAKAASASKSRGRTAKSSKRSNRGSKSARAGGKGQKLSRREATRQRQARARAIYLARLRAIQARDAALRNIAATNIINDNSTGGDPEIRRIAIDALAGRSGTVVVMDPSNGRLHTIVNQRMALGSPVKPCSTVKLIVGLAALHESVFDPNQDVSLSSNGYGMNLTDALARSNNPFFQVLGRRLGYERVMKYASNFGFGEMTGANYPGESPGFLPEEGEQETGHMSSHGDGFGVTAVQLAAFTAAIANGGNLYVPHGPRTPEEAVNFQPILKRKIEITPEDRLRVLSGMIGAVNFGTGKLAYDPAGQVAGKTGTCTGASDKLGLFTSFSSLDNPKLVVTVITNGSTEAGKRAADVAGRVYRAISPRFLREAPLAPAAAATTLPLAPKAAETIHNR
jgi:Penicillin binding protein transpeptidase domain